MCDIEYVSTRNDVCVFFWRGGDTGRGERRIKLTKDKQKELIDGLLGFGDAPKISSGLCSAQEDLAPCGGQSSSL